MGFGAFMSWARGEKVWILGRIKRFQNVCSPASDITPPVVVLRCALAVVLNINMKRRMTKTGWWELNWTGELPLADINKTWLTKSALMQEKTCFCDCRRVMFVVLFSPVVHTSTRRLSQLQASLKATREHFPVLHLWFKEKTQHTPFAPGNRLFSSIRCGIITLFLFTAEIGDFEESKCRSHLLNNNYIPDQMPLIDKIMDFHSRHMWVLKRCQAWKRLLLMQAYFSFRSVKLKIFYSHTQDSCFILLYE